MRQLTNTQISALDTSNPILVRSGTNNTYEYNRDYNAAAQSQFDINLRKALGMPVSGTNYIQTDNYAPSTYNLGMFDAAELLNNGSGYVSYYGYDYKGNPLTGSYSIDDFFNKTDVNGQNTYPVPAFTPIYMAGYIQDHFDFQNIIFDVGLRVDRFDANEPVLKDPYLLYPAKTVAEVESNPNLAEQIPSNVASNDVVYVNSINSPTAIVGYRNGNTWYDSHGDAITDPTVLANATSTGTIQPYLENPSQTTVAANAFTNYTPQINVLPRISFSFPITDKANFFAHYDILSQRPPGGTSNGLPDLYDNFNPVYYLYLPAYASSVISNPALQPQQTVDYTLGYSQVLNEQKSAAITISAFYREMRSLTEVYRYYEAYPTTYLTYGNVDFGTVKGMSIYLDFRRMGDVKMRAGYTLQFADGTGSGPNSGYNLVSSGEPNLQIPGPLSFDVRHHFNFNVDYHFKSGENYDGPVITTKKGKAIRLLENAGFNVTLTALSGTPYTAWSNPIEEGTGISSHYGLVGGVNAENLPWQYRVDARIDKGFNLDVRKHPCQLVIYLQGTNILNTENVLNVYPYTGSPTDDGYLASAAGQQAVPQQTSPKAYVDQYTIAEKQPTYYSLPRLLRLGVLFEF
jgi:hypothetical protein